MILKAVLSKNGATVTVPMDDEATVMTYIMDGWNLCYIKSECVEPLVKIY